jgi:integrase
MELLRCLHTSGHGPDNFQRKQATIREGGEQVSLRRLPSAFVGSCPARGLFLGVLPMKRTKDSSPAPALTPDTGQALPTAASEWHKRPNTSGTCDACGCPVLKIGEHRLKTDGTGWERKSKSPGGFKVWPVTISPPPVPVDQKAPRQPGRPRKELTTFPYCSNSLAEHFYASMLPRHKQAWAFDTRRYFELALSRFLEFLGRDAAIDDTSEEKLDQWQAWLVGKGFSVIHAKDSATALETIVAVYLQPREPRIRRTAETSPTDQAGDDEAALSTVLKAYLLRRKVATQSGYLLALALTSFGRFLGHMPTVADLTDSIVSEWISAFEVRFSPWTASAYRTRLLTLWRMAARQKKCPPPDEVRKCPLPDPMPDSWTEDEVRRLLKACDELEGTVLGVPLGALLRANILAAYDTGLRRTDLWNIHRAQIRPDGMIALRQHKTQRVHVPKLRPATMAAVLALAGDYPLCWPGCHSNFYRPWRKLLKLAGLKGKGALHKLRRTGATLVARDYGLDAARRFLGHRTSEMVYHYVDQSIAVQPMFLPADLMGTEQATPIETKPALVEALPKDAPKTAPVPLPRGCSVVCTW